MAFNTYDSVPAQGILLARVRPTNPDMTPARANATLLRHSVNRSRWGEPTRARGRARSRRSCSILRLVNPRARAVVVAAGKGLPVARGRGAGRHRNWIGSAMWTEMLVIGAGRSAAGTGAGESHSAPTGASCRRRTEGYLSRPPRNYGDRV
jgi:hypothetical protein